MQQIDLPSVPRLAKLVGWKPWDGSPWLLGHCSICFSGGWVVHRVPIFRNKSGGLSAGTPSAARIGPDGKVKTKPDGSRAYDEIISFQGDAAKQRWSTAVLTALSDAGINAGGEL